MARTAIVLAAGRGTRMKSNLSKVLHPLCGQPMIQWTIEAAQSADCEVCVVVGHQAESVQDALDADIQVVLQDPPQGTGDAVRCASSAVPHHGTVLVLSGDTPQVRPKTLARLLDNHGEALCSVLTMNIDPTSAPQSAYGRILRDESGRVVRIVEAANANEMERQICEVNSGIYAFDARWLLEDVLVSLKPHPPKDEYYLTDAVAAAAECGGLQAILHTQGGELAGINDRVQLAEAEAALRRRILENWMIQGVTIRDPSTTYVDASVTLSPDVVLEPGVVLQGDTHISERVHIGPHCVLQDTQVGVDAQIKTGSVCVGARIGAQCHVGPMARLREGTVLEPSAQVGNFVEVKKTTLGAGAKANHLSYLGDTSVGARANIGAGTITCNYDGHAKHETRIGERCFIGSNSALVAPITIGNDAIVGAGSVVTQDVPEGALAVSRAPQKTLENKAQTIHDKNASRADKKT
jgi:bifunctional UDP-N-acetylglucosamine pyrophosphorylase/glucosamine-1-phosphate N-acetyltransferase